MPLTQSNQIPEIRELASAIVQDGDDQQSLQRLKRQRPHGFHDDLTTKAQS